MSPSPPSPILFTPVDVCLKAPLEVEDSAARSVDTKMHSRCILPTLTQSIAAKITVMRNSPRGHSHLEDGVETGEGWLLSETPFPGELWSLSPLLLHDMFASPSNSCPDIILSISSSDICQTQDRYGYFR